MLGGAIKTKVANVRAIQREDAMCTSVSLSLNITLERLVSNFVQLTKTAAPSWEF